ncbi:hypothetical protein D3C71_1344080 [compost metagenome]
MPGPRTAKGLPVVRQKQFQHPLLRVGAIFQHQGHHPRLRQDLFIARRGVSGDRHPVFDSRRRQRRQHPLAKDAAHPLQCGAALQRHHAAVRVGAQARVVVHQTDPLRRGCVLAQNALHRDARPIRARAAIAHPVRIAILARHQRRVKRGRTVLPLKARKRGVGGAYRRRIPRVRDDGRMQRFIPLRATLSMAEIHVVAAEIHVAIGIATQMRRAPGVDRMYQHSRGVRRQGPAAGTQQPSDLAPRPRHQFRPMHARSQDQHMARGPGTDPGHVRK